MGTGHASASGSGDRLEHEARHAAEDPVVGDERNAKPQRGRGNPAIGIVLSLAERVADGFAIHSQLRADLDKLRAGVDDLGALDLRVELEHPCWAPAAAQRTVPELGDGLERDKRRAAVD
jgi:hypothetical protein